MTHLQWLLHSDLSRGTSRHHVAVKQAQHLPNASTLLAGAHGRDRYLGFFSIKTRAPERGDWGKWATLRKGLGAIVVVLCQGWKTYKNLGTWEPSWIQQHYKTLWYENIWKCCLWTSLVWEAATLWICLLFFIQQRERSRKCEAGFMKASKAPLPFRYASWPQAFFALGTFPHCCWHCTSLVPRSYLRCSPTPPPLQRCNRPSWLRAAAGLGWYYDSCWPHRGVSSHRQSDQKSGKPLWMCLERKAPEI